MGGVTLMMDPVCGMKIDPGRAAGKEVHEGKVFYFCSPACMGAFHGDPRRYWHGL